MDHSFYLQFFDIYVAGALGVKELKGLSDLLFLLLGELRFGAGLLAWRRHHGPKGWPLGTGGLGRRLQVDGHQG